MANLLSVQYSITADPEKGKTLKPATSCLSNMSFYKMCELKYMSISTVLMYYSKRRKTEKIGKGLRHFSMKVCEKVKKKGTTSYNEVADELVGEFTTAHMNSLTDQVHIVLCDIRTIEKITFLSDCFNSVKFARLNFFSAI